MKNEEVKIQRVNLTIKDIVSEINIEDVWDLKQNIFEVHEELSKKADVTE